MVRAAGASTVDAPASAEGAAWRLEADVLLAERERQQATDSIDVMLPAHMSVSQLVALQRDPQRLARRLRRPLPEAPDVYARRGTAFHLWLEQTLRWCGTARSR
jgi:DNA helicase-2/ATP-dependent DNA helicase PcrA